MPTYESVLADATRLPAGDQVRLVKTLWDSLPEDSLPPLSDEWLAEIQRRSAELDSGAVSTVSWEQVRNDALRRATNADR